MNIHKEILRIIMLFRIIINDKNSKNTKQQYAMDLDEFIKDVIVSIKRGVSKAESELGSKVLPNETNILGEGIPYVKRKTSGFSDNSPIGFEASMLSTIEFEVSLSESNKDGSSGTIGVLLGSIGIGAKGKSEDEKIALSKIKFNIPIMLN